MRSALLTSLILIGLFALVLRNPRLPPDWSARPVSVRTAEPPAEVKPPAIFAIEGAWMKTVEDADQDALQEAQARVTVYLQNLKPPIDWVPPVDYVEKRLVKKKRVETKDFKDDIGVMRREQVEVEVGPKAVREIVRLDREHRSQQRMLWLAKLLAGLVAALAAVSGYVHLDERTKGYYTTALRLGAAGVVAAVASALWLLC
jgi:hypothetical protein